MITTTLTRSMIITTLTHFMRMYCVGLNVLH